VRKLLGKLALYLLGPAFLLVLLEVVPFIRWMFFNGARPTVDWQLFFWILFSLWILNQIGSPIALWIDASNRRNKRIDKLLVNLDTRFEALYRFGPLYPDNEAIDEQMEEGGDEGFDQEQIAKYKLDAERGSAWSQRNLAIVYSNTHCYRGYRNAVYWYLKADGRDNLNCANDIADCYLEMEQHDKAMFWYRKDIRRGGKLSYFSAGKIADMYAEGKGVSQNNAEAAQWWKRAAGQGYKWAHYALGKLYAEGAEGVEKDEHTAYFHLCAATTGKDAIDSKFVQTTKDELREKIGGYWASSQEEKATKWVESREKV